MMSPSAPRSPIPSPTISAPPAVPIRLSTYALAAIAAAMGNLVHTEATAPELQFLQQQWQAVTTARQPWLDSLRHYIQQPAPSDVPLLQLIKPLQLTLLEVLAIALATAVEASVMVGRAVARVQAPLGGSRPTLGLLATALADSVKPGVSVLHTLLAGQAIQSGLLQRLNETAPLPEQTISVPLHLCLALAGYDGNQPGTTLGLDAQTTVPLPPSTLATAAQHGISLQTAHQPLLVIRSGCQREGRSVAAAIAQTRQCRPLFITTEKPLGLAPWLLLRRLLPVFCLDLAPGEHKTIPAIPAYGGAVLVLCGLEGSVESVSGSALNWSLPVPAPAERQHLWQLALGQTEATQALATELATTHRHSSGRIMQLGQLSQHQSQLQGRSHPLLEDVIAAAWSGEGIGLDALAQPLPDPIPDAALVMPPSLQADLEALLLRCRYRDRLVIGLGAAATARYHPGVRALLVGPSGTGKTLAASWLATRLGLPIYRVDLAAITSKYIGETEKNLAQLLSRAEQAEVVLLFDEADSMFGKRTDVKDSNDRFANAQTNYLLQRIETFDGIVLLTSNSRNRFDAAFTRRLDLMIEFPLPAPEERRSLWQSHLGDHHDLTQRDLNQLAALCELGGGHIRNAVLTAAVLAQSQGRAIAFGDVRHGLAGEYRKLSQPMPAELDEGLLPP